VLKELFREKLMNVFLRKIAFCCGKLLAQPAKPVDTITALQTANWASYLHNLGNGLSPG